MNEVVQFFKAPPLIQAPGALPPGCDTDALLTAAQMAIWLQLSEDTVLRKAKAGVIPCIREGSDVRFHPKSYLASRGAIAGRWQHALQLWEKLTGGLIQDAGLKRQCWRDFGTEFRHFEEHGPRIPAGA